MMADVETAISLMRMALALLDRAGERDVAARLQQAISIADREPVPRSIEEADALIDTPEARSLMQRLSGGGSG